MLSTMSIESFYEQVKASPKRVVLPEGEDLRILQAARQLADDGLAKPIVLSDGTTEALAQEYAISLDGISIIDPAKSERLAEYESIYHANKPKTPKEAVAGLVRQPLNFGGLMVRTGEADALVAGAANPTAAVIRAGLATIGVAEGIKLASSFMYMLVPNFLGGEDKAFIYADCAVNINPNSEQLADIAIASAESAKKLLTEDPKLAMLSFSTHGSAQHEMSEKVIEATKLLKERAPNLAIEGEVQLDAAIVPRVAAKKLSQESQVAGQANTLIFPDLNAGNISYKLTQYMADAKAIGPLLQGFAKPISDLSRGASVEDIVLTSVIISVLGSS